MAFITIFKGTKDDIPVGWRLCDGNNGTPNLVDKFVKGVNSFDEIGDIGTGNHSHTTTTAGSHSHGDSDNAGTHRHGLSSSTGTGARTGSDFRFANESHTHATGAGGGHRHSISTVKIEPPFYQLCYIQAEQSKWDMPVGSIVMWSGGSDLVRGWQLCDGTNGTVDLRDRFIKGHKTKGSTGGNSTHTHSTLATNGAHTHTMQAKEFKHTHRIRTTEAGKRIGVDGGTEYETDSVEFSHTHGGLVEAGSHGHSINAASNDPPYYKLAFIQRIF